MMMNHQWWQHHETQRDIKFDSSNDVGSSARISISRRSIRGPSHHKYIVHQVQLDQCSYQGFSKRKKNQSAAAAKVMVELES